MAPRVSVVIPCYNYGRFLADAVRSALVQTLADREVIVVDDGSTDDTADVARSFGDPVRYVHQTNAGPSAARNTGLQAAHGKYLVFVDADDRLRPRALETGVTLLEVHPTCAFVAGRHVYIDADGGPLPARPGRRHVGKDHYLALLRSNYIGCPATVMYRRTALVAVNGFDPACRYGEDYDLYLRIARLFRVLCHDDVVAAYRRHGANSSRNLEKMRTGTCAVLRAQLPYLARQPRYEEACRRGIALYEGMFESEQLVEKVRTLTRARRWRQAAREMVGLLHRHPQVFALHAGRKLRGTMLGDRRAGS